MQDLINNKITELTNNGKLDEIITKEATSFLQKMVSNTLSSYSDVGKEFEAKLKAAVLNGFDKLDFVSYASTLNNVVEAELNKSIVEYGLAPAREMLKRFTGELEKKEWKLSEILAKFIESEVIEEGEEDSGTIGLVVEPSDYGTIWIGFDEKEKSRRYECKYRLGINKKDGRFWTFDVDGLNISPLQETPLGGFNLFLFKLYAMQCTIIVDEKDCEVEWSTYHD